MRCWRWWPFHTCGDDCTKQHLCFVRQDRAVNKREKHEEALHPVQIINQTKTCRRVQNLKQHTWNDLLDEGLTMFWVWVCVVCDCVVLCWSVDMGVWVLVVVCVCGMSLLVSWSVSVDLESGLFLGKNIVASCSCQRVDMSLSSCRVVVVVSKVCCGDVICSCVV